MHGLFKDIFQFLFPEAIPLWQALGLIILSFFTSFMSASIGIGGGKAMLGVMAGVIPVNVLIAVHAFVQVGSNAGRAWVQRANIRWPVVRRYIMGAIVGVGLGALFFVSLPEHILFLILGLYILWTVWVPERKDTRFDVTKIGIPVIGFVTAFMSTMLGTTAALVNATLRKLGLNRYEMIGTQAACVLVQHILKVIVFVALGVAIADWLGMIILMILVGFVGTWAGTKLLNVMSETWFDRILKAVLSLVALDLLLQGIMHFV